MKTNKQEREYHKIKKANRQMHYDKMPEEEAIKDFSYEECMKLGYIQMGKRLPYYYGKDKEMARKKRYSKRKDIENGLNEEE